MVVAGVFGVITYIRAFVRCLDSNISGDAQHKQTYGHTYLLLMLLLIAFLSLLLQSIYLLLSTFPYVFSVIFFSCGQLNNHPFAALACYACVYQYLMIA